MTFREELTALLNRHSIENDTNTPDYLLAGYLIGCLSVYEQVCRGRDAWYGMNPEPGTDWATRIPEQPEHRKVETR